MASGCMAYESCTISSEYPDPDLPHLTQTNIGERFIERGNSSPSLSFSRTLTTETFSSPNLSHLTLPNTTTLPRARATIAKRTMSGESRQHMYKDIPTNVEQLRTNIWLSDVGAYPVLVVLTFAIGMSGSFIGYQAVKNPDVRITTGKRQEMIRSWDTATKDGFWGAWRPEKN